MRAYRSLSGPALLLLLSACQVPPGPAVPGVPAGGATARAAALWGPRGCPPGLVACGAGCYDHARDPEHCGNCATRCAPGQACEAGACRGPGSAAAERAAESRPSGSSAIGPAVEIDGEPATTTCSGSAEAYPERSLTFGTAEFFMPFQHSGQPSLPYNWGSSAGSWNSPASSILVAGMGSTSADSWATTSGATGLEYVSRILQPFGYAGTCIGIAATDPNSMASGTWTYPLACATAQHPSLGDGPSVHFDEGSTNLFAVETDFAMSPVAIVLHAFPNCQAGPVGPSGSTCLEAPGSPTVVASNTGSHATVTVNPCTHDAIVAYYDPSGGISLNFFGPTGVPVAGPFQIDASAPWAQTSACAVPGCDNDGMVPRCGGICGTVCGQSPGCARTAPKVHVATKYDPATGSCYAYAAYDKACSANGATYMQSNFAVVNITSEAAPVVVQNYNSGSCSGSSPFNTFMSVSTANEFTGGVGWFFYMQPPRTRYSVGGPCNTYFVGYTDTALGLSSMSYAGALAGPFPTMRFDAAHGMGDYVGAVKRGLPGGYLFPTWAQPVPTSASCVSCQTQQWSLAVYGATVLP